MTENTTPPSKPARKKSAARKQSGPRKLDPGLAELRKLHSANVAAYRAKTASQKLLATIVNKRLAQLTQEDRLKLLDALKPMTTPALSINHEA
jgi:hypothetical protein